ncbi:MAG: DUF1838 domain-containing protein [Gammaproteobacteria bacterium]|nr:DUF1838 domain-containing protein [Gammaproteobacteria bacterium]
MADFSRRDFMNQVGIGAASAAALAATGCASVGSSVGAATGNNSGSANSVTGPNFNLIESAEDNMIAYARLQGNLDSSKTKYGWYKGMVSAVMPDKVVRDLFMMEGFSCARLLPKEDGIGYHKVLREVGFYREQRFGRSGDIMSEWRNPLTKETVRVVPIANDPFNYDITPFFPEPPNYGGLNAGQPFPKIPLKLPWEKAVYNNNARLDTRINLFYPSALQPDEWPRESSGSMNRVTEIFQYNIDVDDLQNPDLTTTKYNGTWARITPWLPWMLMGQTPGHIVYTCYMGSIDSLDVLPDDLVAAAEAIDPKYLEAPTEVYGPSLSSLENYAIEQTPAPVKD